MTVTDAHIHVQPWWELKPEVLELMTRGRADVDELQKIMKSPEHLLRRLDADAEVRRDGRSAVLRRATAEYLRRRRARHISEAYRKAYGAEAGLGAEFAGWEEEGSWPAS